MYNSEKNLFLAVIQQAIADATANASTEQLKRFKRQVEKWIFGKDLDFEFVCNLADIEPECVRRKVLERKEGENNGKCNNGNKKSKRAAIKLAKEN